MAELDLIELAVAAARARDLPRLADLLSPNFFARLASGRIIIGETGFVEAVSYGTVVSTPAAEGFADLEDLGGGFVLSHEHRSGSSALEPGAWLVHVRDGRVNALMHFPTAGAAVDSLPPHVRDPQPVELVERALEASNERDLVALVGLIATDYELVGAGGERLRGLARVLDLHQLIDETYEHYETEADRIELLGPGDVLVLGRIVSKMPGGDPKSVERAFRAVVENGLVRRWSTFEDAEQARAARDLG